MIEKISVIGAGSWGTTLAKLLAEKKEFSVKLWVRQKEQAELIKKEQINKKYLPKVLLPEELEIITHLQNAFPADLVILAVPSHAVRNTAKLLSQYIQQSTSIVSCAKGLEEGTFYRMSEIISQECPSAYVCVMSGPNHAEEVALKQPTATVIGSSEQKVAQKVQQVFTSFYFRPYTNDDIIGVELGGAFKNIVAIALGILDGLGYQDNIKAATMTRGLAEISRLGVALGASPVTFLGLSGMGDLITTCTSRHSRNRWAGEQLAKGKKIEQILASTDMVVEGVKAIHAAYALAKQLSVEMPITYELYNVLHENKDVGQAVLDLMQRDYKAEL